LLVAFPFFSHAYNFQLAHYVDVRAAELGVDPTKIHQLIMCESGYTHYLPSGKLIARDAGLSVGLFQFKHDTFNEFAKQYGITQDRSIPFFQADVAIRMIRDGLWYHWKNCGLKVGLNHHSSLYVLKTR
jgi:hypothetical protein